VDVPDMGYKSSDQLPRGEIAISGYNVVQGYYNLPEKTAESFKKDANGKLWFYTGNTYHRPPYTVIHHTMKFSLRVIVV
jgi:long-subunit acyl-CoA synthetase (AMP-forming)